MTIASQLLESQVQITVAGVQVVHVVRVMHLVLRVRHVNAVQQDVRTGATQRLPLTHRFPAEREEEERNKLRKPLQIEASNPGEEDDEEEEKGLTYKCGSTWLS